MNEANKIKKTLATIYMSVCVYVITILKVSVLCVSHAHACQIYI